MLEASLIEPIAKTIAQALMAGFVEGDRVIWSLNGKYNRKGTIVRLNRRLSGFSFPVVRFDDETRPDMLHQECLPSDLKRIDEE